MQPRATTLIDRRDESADGADPLAGLRLPDNSPQGLAALLRLNEIYRNEPWPAPYNQTTHHVACGDARDLAWIADESIHLVVTSPPYWTLKRYEDRSGQLGHVKDYEHFLDQLDRVWRECARVLVPGGRICCVVGDVCLARKEAGRHLVMPLHADIQVRSRINGLDCLTPILWYKIANGVTEASGNGAGFYGKPFQPGAVVKNDIEYVLFLRKPGYRRPEPIQKALSMLSRTEMRQWFQPIWSDIKGASTRAGHPAPFPNELAERLIRMFSFAGDTVLDPFLGSGSTSVAAIHAGRHSIGNELEPKYIAIARRHIDAAAAQIPMVGAVHATVVYNNP
ncbi:methyltransferase [bacterium]|nr:site-specific DNA-methyltransferase [Chloroflexi bacterium CFX6]RIL12080.1 MAG: methyltransferase [bacterium]